jgi:hypothetical protein
VHNNDFYYYAYPNWWKHWVDISPAVYADWDYKNFLWNAKLTATSSKNYQWQQDKVNFQGQLSVMYFF